MRGVLLIGASTGAPRSHHVYLQTAPRGFPWPIVIVQHMPCGPFIEGVLRYLRDTVALPSKLAEDGDPLRAGEVLLAVPGTHIRFDRTGTRVRVAPDAGENAFAPSMNVAFGSAAPVFGPRCLVGMMSGLHAEQDGVDGCRAVRRAGGKVVVTDRATTPCYHMVRQVRQAGEWDSEAPLNRLLMVMTDLIRDPKHATLSR